MPTFRVAHVSDIHCDGTKIWQDRFDRLTRALADEMPDLVAITGDCVNHPHRHLYEFLSQSITRLCDELSHKSSRFYVLVVPGNHDRFLFGNKFFSIPSALFENNCLNLLHPNIFANITDLLDDIFIQKHVAVFPLDSTQSQSLIAWARGRVAEPHTTLRELADRFRKLAMLHNIHYDTCIKIAMLHHHLIPLPASALDEKLEPFNLVQNPYELLDAIATQHIDVVLNGHRHVSAISELRMHSVAPYPVIISACGQSASCSGESEFKIIEFEKSGASNVHVAKADHRVNKFDQMPTLPLVPYAERRRRKWGEPGLYRSCPNLAVESMTRKTKLLRILENNSALAQVQLDGVKWRRGCAEQDMVIIEQAQADIGRIPLLRYMIDTDRYANSFIEKTRSEFTESALATAEPEMVELELRPNKGLDATIPAYCRIEYPLFNGYVLNQTEHEDAYGNTWDGEREEAAGIRVHYPTETLQLVIQFPSKETFPHPDDIHFDVYEHTGERKGSLDNLQRKYTEFLDNEEKELLRRQHALQCFEGFNEIVFTVNYPQPDLSYNVRWRVPEDSRRIGLTEVEAYELRRLRETLATDIQRRERFYEKLVSALQPLVGDDATILLFAVDEQETTTTGRLLRVVCGPDPFRWAKLCVGRGMAGKAFKMREVDYYQKGVGIINNIERLSGDMEPYAILALPLLYPEPPGGSDTKKGRAFGVVSIIAAKQDSLMVKRIGVARLSDEDRQAYLKRLYDEAGLAYAIAFG